MLESLGPQFRELIEKVDRQTLEMERHFAELQSETRELAAPISAFLPKHTEQSRDHETRLSTAESSGRPRTWHGWSAQALDLPSGGRERGGPAARAALTRGG